MVRDELPLHSASALASLTEVSTGSKLAYIEGPDDMLIELVRPAA